MAKLISADLTNNKLCILEYTTTDGQMLSFKEDAFNAKIVSHTYTNLGKVIFDKPITKIGEEAFEDCVSLTSVTIPDSVTTIGNSAFWGCDSLASVTIPDSVTTIGMEAFSWCTSLKSVTIPDSVTTIGDKAFEYCNSLTSVTIGNGITTIGIRAFSDCPSLTSVTIGNGVTTIGGGAFFCTNLKEVLHPTDNCNLFIVEKDNKYGVYHRELGLLTSIDFDSVQVQDKIVYVEKDNIGYLLFNGYELIKEIHINRYSTSKIYKIASNYIIYRTYGYSCIINMDGKIVIENVGKYTEYKNLFILYTTRLDNADYYEYEDCDSFVASIYNKDFEQIHPGEYLREIRGNNSGIFIGQKDDLHIIYDEYGNKLFSTKEYSIINNFYEGLAVVCKDELYGVIDINGNVVVPCKHSEITNFNNGVATTTKYDEKIEIYRDGSMQPILPGRFIDDNLSDRSSVFCQIIDNHLHFTDNKNNVLTNYLHNNPNELITITYIDGIYSIINAPSYNNIEGKLFLVNKNGGIIHWGNTNRLHRISSRCLIYGVDNLTIQSMSVNSFTKIAQRGDCNEALFISSSGVVAAYISSANSDIHFTYNDDDYNYGYHIFDKYGSIIQSSCYDMNILLKPDNSFKILSYNDYSTAYNKREDDNNEHLMSIDIWDSKTMSSKQNIASCTPCLIDASKITLSKNKDYIIIPINKHRSYYRELNMLHLIVLNKFDAITIDNDFGYAKIESIYDNKILLANYYEDVKESRNEYTEENEYYVYTSKDGYQLVLLDGSEILESCERPSNIEMDN